MKIKFDKLTHYSSILQPFFVYHGIIEDKLFDLFYFEIIDAPVWGNVEGFVRDLIPDNKNIIRDNLFEKIKE